MVQLYNMILMVRNAYVSASIILCSISYQNKFAVFLT